MLAHLRRHSHDELADTAGGDNGDYRDGGVDACTDEPDDDPYRLWVSTSPVLWNYDHAGDADAAGGQAPAKALARS
jgi:hypothetical protein